MADPRQEYADARAAYAAALERLREAKKHIPQTARDRYRERVREERRERREKEAAFAETHGAWLNALTAKALVVLHQKVSTMTDDPGDRFRFPVRYHVVPKSEGSD